MAWGGEFDANSCAASVSYRVGNSFFSDAINMERHRGIKVEPLALWPVKLNVQWHSRAELPQS